MTKEELINARDEGWIRLDRDAEFYLHRRLDDDLKRPGMVVKSGTVVYVNKVFRKGQAALLCYIDKSGKVWWSWKHAQ